MAPPLSEGWVGVLSFLLGKEQEPMPQEPRALTPDMIRDIAAHALRTDRVLHVGFTGTRHLGEFGEEAILGTLVGIAKFCKGHDLELEVVQGGCVGTDTFVAEVAMHLTTVDDPPRVTVHTILPEDMSRVPREWRSLCHTYESVPGAYRERNKAVVRRVQCLFGIADYPEAHGKSRRSGTWQTIRLGREANIPVMVLIQHEDEDTE